MNKQRSLITVIGLLVVAGVLHAFAFPVLNAQEEDTGERGRLRKAIKRVESEIESVKKSHKQQKKEQQETLEKIRSKRKKLGGEIVQLLRSQQKLKAERSSLRNKKEKLQKEYEKRKNRPAELRELVRTIQERLRRIDGRIPPTRDRRGAPLLSGLGDDPETLSGSELVDTLETLIKRFRPLLESGVEVQTFRTEVISSEGRTVEADVLRVGHVFVAYSTPDGNRAGIATRSREENGFRWQEQLPERWKHRISDAIERVKNDEMDNGGSTNTQDPDEFFELPVDPTLEMSARTTNRSKTLQERLVSGGAVMIPLAAIAVIGLFLVAERFWVLWGERSGVRQLGGEVREQISRGNIEKAERLCADHDKAVPSVLNVLLSSRSLDPEAIQDRVEEAILEQMPRLERFLPTLSVLAAVAPLLGLLGTVTGIIETFDVIAVFGSGNQKLMAGGISEALITTATGLAIAIPLLLCHGFFRGRVDAIVGDMEREAAATYNRMMASGKDTTDSEEENADEEKLDGDSS